MNRLIPWLSLFASSGTLVCCALPSLLVVLGMGATMAGLVSAVPGLVVLSQHKTLVFGLSGVLILSAGILQYRSTSLTCPTDPHLAKACASSRKYSVVILIFSGLIWLMGAFFAFLAPYIFI